MRTKKKVKSLWSVSVFGRCYTRKAITGAQRFLLKAVHSKVIKPTSLVTRHKLWNTVFNTHLSWKKIQGIEFHITNILSNFWVVHSIEHSYFIFAEVIFIKNRSLNINAFLHKLSAYDPDIFFAFSASMCISLAIFFRHKLKVQDLLQV